MTIPFSFTASRTETLTVPEIVLIALGIMSGKIWFTMAGFMVAGAGERLSAAWAA